LGILKKEQREDQEALRTAIMRLLRQSLDEMLRLPAWARPQL
jgi:hypothetical protein